MFVPEYTITTKTLKNIALIEYGKAVIENTVILPSWEKQLRSQKSIDEAYSLLQLEGFNFDLDLVKKTFDSLVQDPPKEISQIKNAFDVVVELSKEQDVDESGLKKIYKTLSGRQTYRSAINKDRVKPEEILAEMVELFDWLNSIDARDSHPVIVASIAKARLEEISPFDTYNISLACILANLVLMTFDYNLRNYVGLSLYFNRGKKDYFEAIKSLNKNTNDFTQWIEYFSGAFATQVATTQEKVKLLAKDTKIAKVSGRTKLTQRQERIVEYLQDYGVMQNKDFSRLFPDISADSVLRDIKALVDSGMVVKAGSTKSSRYELA